MFRFFLPLVALLHIFHIIGLKRAVMHVMHKHQQNNSNIIVAVEATLAICSLIRWNPEDVSWLIVSAISLSFFSVVTLWLPIFLSVLFTDWPSYTASFSQFLHFALTLLSRPMLSTCFSDMCTLPSKEAWLSSPRNPHCAFS